MRRTIVGIGLLVVCLLAFSGGVVAQAGPPPEMKKWEPVVGKWTSEEEYRQSPAHDWENGSADWEIRFMEGGYFVVERGNWRIGGMLESTWLAVVGYDLHRETTISSLWSSDGYRDGITSGGWSGTTFTCHWSGFWADGRPVEGRCIWVYSADYRTVTGTCDEFKNGKWWNIRKAKGKRVD